MARDLIFAFVCTILVGFFADVFLGGYLNWPGCGAVFAVATMGCFILRALCQKGGADDAEKGE